MNGARPLAFIAATLIAIVPYAARSGQRTNDAPADEYFGPLKMSAISVRTRIDALGRRYHARTISDEDLLHDAGLVETSFKLWHDRYPRDAWLPPTGLHLEQLYAEVQTPQARTLASAMLHYVVSEFPTSHQAHLCRLRLAQGFAPLHSETAVTSTPNPYGAQAVANGSPAPGSTALSSPAPSASAPSASSASPAAGAPSAGPLRSSPPLARPALSPVSSIAPSH